MRKRIGIDELQPGMLVEKLDRSWWSTPFFRHKMTIASPQQIAQLKAYGVETLIVSFETGKVGEVSEVVPDVADDSAITGAEEAASMPPIVQLEQELPAARQVYQAAKTIVQHAMHDTRLGRAINVQEVHRVVSEMTESVVRNPDALTSLSRLKQFDEYTFYHSVNTSLLAMSLGRDLGFDRSILHQVGVGTLLHDIGKTKIPLEILNKPGRFETHEMEIMKQHVLRGVEVLATSTGLGDSYVQPALEHHERVRGIHCFPIHTTWTSLNKQKRRITPLPSSLIRNKRASIPHSTSTSFLHRWNHHALSSTNKDLFTQSRPIASTTWPFVSVTTTFFSPLSSPLLLSLCAEFRPSPVQVR